ncbi:MAG TPA: APC family permease [Solirubrobacteraceae bacterium]|nr:APC family permease [Solirubrobacteraceae bacterium]
MAASNGLAARLSAGQFLTIGIGAIMGVGWAVALGDWLESAAPLGAILGFALGGALMLPVALCYAELATALPTAGGEVVYLAAVFGLDAAFMVGWFVVLMAVAITSFEGISLAWFLGQMIPGIDGAVAYRLLGKDIHSGALLIGAVFTGLITLVNLFGAHAAGRFQEIFTYVKGLAILAFVAAAIALGSLDNLSPPLTPIKAAPAIYGVLWIASTASLWFAGFQVVPQAIEERRGDTSVRTVARMTVLALVLGVVFYCAVVLASTLAVPWHSIVAAPLPAALAIHAVVRNDLLARLVLGAVVLGILATWNSAFLWSSRLLLALGRQGMLPEAFGRIGRLHSPVAAVVLVGSLGLLGICLGRGALVPIINMASISLTFSYAFACWAVLRLRRTLPGLERPFRVPGGTFTMRLAIVTTTAMGGISLFQPLVRDRRVPLEWLLLLGWTGLGLALLFIARQRRRVTGVL